MGGWSSRSPVTPGSDTSFNVSFTMFGKEASIRAYGVGSNYVESSIDLNIANGAVYGIESAGRGVRLPGESVRAQSVWLSVRVHTALRAYGIRRAYPNGYPNGGYPNGYPNGAYPQPRALVVEDFLRLRPDSSCYTDPVEHEYGEPYD